MRESKISEGDRTGLNIAVHLYTIIIINSLYVIQQNKNQCIVHAKCSDTDTKCKNIHCYTREMLHGQKLAFP